jgi:hypothetical protein
VEADHKIPDHAAVCGGKCAWPVTDPKCRRAARPRQTAWAAASVADCGRDAAVDRRCEHTACRVDIVLKMQGNMMPPSRRDVKVESAEPVFRPVPPTDLALPGGPLVGSTA